MAEQRRSVPFFSDHTHVLVHVARHPDAESRQIADALGLDERTVERLLEELVAADVLVVQGNGYAVRASAQVEPGFTVADLIERVSSWRRRSTAGVMRKKATHRSRRALFGLL